MDQQQENRKKAARKDDSLGPSNQIHEKELNTDFGIERSSKNADLTKKEQQTKSQTSETKNDRAKEASIDRSKTIEMLKKQARWDTFKACLETGLGALCIVSAATFIAANPVSGVFVGAVGLANLYFGYKRFQQRRAMQNTVKRMEKE